MKKIKIDGLEVRQPSTKALYHINQIQQSILRLIELDVHEDVIDYLNSPVEDVLKKCGINLQENDY